MKLVITGQKRLNTTNQVEQAINATGVRPTLILLVAQHGGFGTGLIKNWAARHNVSVKVLQAKTSVHGRLAERIRINHAINTADHVLVIGEPTNTGKRMINTAKYLNKPVTKYTTIQEETHGSNPIFIVDSAA